MPGDSKYVVEISTNLVVDRLKLWRHIVCMVNVNKELMPYLRMTYPSDMSELPTGVDIPSGVTLFTSVLLLFGIIPFDLHYLKLDRIVEGKAFYENSTTLMQRYWKHTRTLTEKGNGVTQLTDVVEFMPRLSFLGPIVFMIVRFLFQHRHRQLKKSFKFV